MKNLLFGISLALLLTPTASFGQGSWLDATNVVGNGDVIITDLSIDSNGDSYLTGWFDTNIISTAGSIVSNGSFDIFLLKINSDGTHAWLKGFGGNFPDLPGGVEIGPDNSIYISGAVNGTVFFDATTSITTTNADAFLANYDPDGTLNWVKIVAGGPKNQRSETMAIDNDKIIISGFAVDSVIYDVARVGYAGKFTHVSTYDLSGNHLLYNTIGFKDVGLPTSIAPTTDGYVISGYFRDSLFLDIDSLSNSSLTPSSDIFLYKTDKNLNGQWVRQTTSLFGENIGYSVRFDGVDDIYLIGKTGSLDMQIDSTDADKVQIIRTTGSDEFFIFNYLNSTGNLDWYSIDGSNRADGLWDVLIMPDRLISTGYYNGDYYFGNDTLTNPISKEILLIEHDLNGNVIHARNAFSDPARDSDQGYRLGLNQLGEIVVAGVYRSEIINFEDVQFSNISPGDPDIFLATYGCLGGGSLSTSSSDLLCYNDYSGEITVTASGGFTNPQYGHAYDAFFDNGDTVINRKFFSPSTLTGFPAGTYDITVYDNANCMIGTSVETLNQPDSLQFTYVVVHPDCDAATTGSITISDPLGGTSPYQYSINCGTDFQPDASFTDLPAGVYCIIVEDANGCQTQAIDTTLVAPVMLAFEFDVINDSLTCFGEMDSEIHFKNVSGGTGDYLFSIDGGTNYQADTFFLNLGGGNYQLIVSDVNACASAVVDTTIYQPEEILFEYAFSDTLCFGETGDILFSSPSGGSGNYWFSVDGGMVYLPDTAFLGVNPGNYRLLVRDDILCVSDTIDVTIVVPELFRIVSVTSDSITSNSDGSIEVVVEGGTEPYEYILYPDGLSQGIGNFIFITGDSGTYWVEVNDDHNCGPVATDPIEIKDYTGIKGFTLLDAMVYPNPSSGIVTIEMRYDKSECTLEVLSLTGQVVISRRVYPNGGKLNESIDLQSLAKGMYMLRIDGKMLRSGIVLK
ncbi:MAG: T9SS type A sorting domain-containing protein [Bacteroidales bacterium]|nr:T9SS type A sorting domain-containing protein [Bacteroidales bacterium]